MKCSICGHRSNTIQAMAAHYRKKHPSRMKQRSGARAKKIKRGLRYCSECGRRI